MPVSDPTSNVSLSVKEKDVLKAVLEFLELRGLHIAQLSLERETGIINGQYSDDLLFLRQLIIDGQWDNAIDFVEPLKGCEEFDFREFRYNITKHKFFELLCIKLEPGPMHDNDFAVEELVECLKDLEHITPSPEDYRYLCALLTLPKLDEHSEFHNWNPSSARIECFNKIVKLVGHLLPSSPNDKSIDTSFSSHDRLFSLLSKGVFYEGCVDFCQAQAIGDLKDPLICPRPGPILSDRPRLSSMDLSLISWLENVSREQFAMPFQQKLLDMKVEALKKPKLEAQWTEQILATPIKPGGAFPHSHVPVGKLKFTEKMSQSISGIPMTNSMMTSCFPSNKPHPMSQSTAPGFSLNGGLNEANEDAMVQSQRIENLFETSELTKSSRPDTASRSTSSSMIQSFSPQVLHPAMVQSMNGPYDFSSTRRQLDEITRRSLPPPSSQRQSSLPPLAEVSPNKEDNSMTKSVLFQQFANKQKSDSMMYSPMPNTLQPLHISHQPPPLSHHSASLPPHSSMSPAFPILPPTSMGPVPGYMEYGSQMNGVPYPMPNGSSNIPHPYPYAPSTSTIQPAMVQQRPHSMVAPPSVSHPISSRPLSMPNSSGLNVQFVPVCRYEDPQAIRAVSFHPSGNYFAIGTNSKQMHICRYPDIKRQRNNENVPKPEVLLSRPKQHRGSVYCLSFSSTGELLATGSNDKSMRLMSFNSEECKIGAEMELSCHDGTIRDMIFLDDSVNRTSLLVSGGAGNCHINLTDCNTGQTVIDYKGHSAPILGLYTWGGGPQFVSCSQDKTIRFWDVRSGQSINVIQPNNKTSSSPVTSVCVDPSGQLLVSGHEDASVSLYNITGRRILQSFRPHGDEVRTVRFSNAAYYLLSASYDKRVVITDMRGDLMAPLMYLPVAEHSDKVIQCRWHPHDFSFLSTSADRTAVLWALPPPQ